MSHISPIKQRLRLTYGKAGPLKYTSNLDVAKIWERVLRRADLPILYTEGFNTRPRLQLATPLPLGISSECEIIDVALREVIEYNEEDLIEQLHAVSPTGLQIYKIESVAIDEPAMQTRVRSAEYRIRFEDGIDPTVLQEHIDTILNAEQILKTKIRRKGRKKGRKTTRDIRPLIHDLTINEAGELIAHLAVGDYGNLRPDALLDQMNLSENHHTVHRFRIYLAD